MPASTRQFAKQYDGDINRIWAEEYAMYPAEYPKLFKSEDAPSGKHYTEAEISGLGPLQAFGEGEGVPRDLPEEGNEKQRTYSKFGLSFEVTEEAVEDELFGKIMEQPKSLAISAHVKTDTESFDLFNNGFATHLAMDGNYIFVASGRTLLKDGAAQNNRPSTDIALSETGVQTMMEYFYGLENHAGMPIVMIPTILLIPKELRKTAKVLLETYYKPDSMDNDVNSLNDAGLSMFVSRYLTSATAWFGLSDDHDFRIYWKKRASLESNTDFETDNLLYKTVTRFATFCNRPWGGWGTTG